MLVNSQETRNEISKSSRTTQKGEEGRKENLLDLIGPCRPRCFNLQSSSVLTSPSRIPKQILARTTRYPSPPILPPQDLSMGFSQIFPRFPVTTPTTLSLLGLSHHNLRCENGPVNSPVNRDTGLEMPCCFVTDLLWV